MWKNRTFDDSVEYKKGKGLSRNVLTENGTECILYGDLYTIYKDDPIIENVINFTNEIGNFVLSNINDVIVPSSGESATDISLAGCVKKSGVILGGDLNVLTPLNNINGEFLAHQIRGVRKNDIARVSQGASIVHLNYPQFSEVIFSYPSYEEQTRIADFLKRINKRIEVQMKLIDDYESLIKCIIDTEFQVRNDKTSFLGENIKEKSVRNESEKELDILSINNKMGFVLQENQFQGRSIASEDVSNYKIVKINNFAYNPSRINVGSIAKMNDFEIGIISPMYICFEVVGEKILSDYLKTFFMSSSFKKELSSKLEGSVRQSLSFNNLKKIKIINKTVKEQTHFVQNIRKIEMAITVLKLNHIEFVKIKQYLLLKMFI